MCTLKPLGELEPNLPPYKDIFQTKEYETMAHIFALCGKTTNHKHLEELDLIHVSSNFLDLRLNLIYDTCIS